MKKLNIEWKHLEGSEGTCLRCSETGKTLDQVVKDLTKELKPRGVRVTFTETELLVNQLPQSNMILFNGVPLENVLSEIRIFANYCESCSCLTESEAYCRAVEYKGKIYEEIPEAIIRQAALKAVGLA